MMDLRRGRGKERAFDNPEVLVENYLNMREGLKGLNLEQTGGPKDTEFDEKYSRAPQFPLDNWISGNDFDMNTSRSTSVNASLGDIPSHLKNFAGSVRSRGTVDQWGVERDRFEGFYGSPRLHSEQRGIPNEGPSNYKLDSFDGEQKYRGDLCEVEDLEQDRAELLWKLDELKEKLSRAYDVVGEKPREKMVPMEHSRTPPDPYGDRLTYNLSMQPYAVDKQMTRPPYMDMQNFYAHQRHGLNAIPEYEGPSQPQLNMRHPHPHQALHYPRTPPHEYFMGNHMDSNLNYLASYTHENVFHSPACSCLGCYNQNFGTGRVPQAPSNLNAYQHVNPGTFLPHDYNPRHATPPPPLNRRWKNDIESDNDGYGDRHPRRAVAVNRQHGRIFHPVAGGAPFISCFSCFELLKLPRKLKKANMNGSKLRCGSCSTVILLGIKNKKLITSVSKEMKLSSEVDQRSNEVLKGSSFSSCGSPKAIETNSSCDDLDTKEHSLAEDKRLNLDEYEKRQGLTSNEVPKGSSLSSRGSPKAIETNSSCDDLGTKDKSLADDKRLNLDESEKRQGLTSSSSVSSKEEEEVSDFLISHRGVSESAELPLPAKDSFSPARPGSPLWEQSESPSKNALHIDGKGIESERMDQDKVLFSRTSSRQNSVNDRSVETEVDVSYNEYLNTTNISQDSADGNKDEDRRKGADSFFVGLIKKSFRDLSKSSQTLVRTRPNVLINGQPIPDHLVKKAEKLAGPIQPGDYWYDFRAGFWGVMGHTCLGIIPPFIEEFYYPMPANCGAGNTGVYVNGRELHQRDLDLLASRGLPTTRDKFYIVEISGRVVDEDSGKELDSLGKLAPTIEKAKHGFGMKVPRMAV